MRLIQGVNVGDVIQSFDVTNPIDPSRASYVGEVTKVEIDPESGIEYVYFAATLRVRAGVTEAVYYPPRELRAPQNGTPSFSGPTDGIVRAMKENGIYLIPVASVPFAPVVGLVRPDRASPAYMGQFGDEEFEIDMANYIAELEKQTGGTRG